MNATSGGIPVSFMDSNSEILWLNDQKGVGGCGDVLHHTFYNELRVAPENTQFYLPTLLHLQFPYMFLALRGQLVCTVGVGVGVFVFLPVFKAVTVLSLFMGIMFGFEVPQILTDAIHYGESERKAQSFTSSPLLNFFSKNSP